MHDNFVQPTVSSLIDMVKALFVEICRQVGVDLVPIALSSLLGLGIHSPMVGFPLLLDASCVDHGRRLRSWTLHRPIRRSADLARPFTQT